MSSQKSNGASGSFTEKELMDNSYTLQSKYQVNACVAVLNAMNLNEVR